MRHPYGRDASGTECLQDQEEGVSMEEVAELIETLLLEKASMLEEYLALKIDDRGRLCTLPQLIEGFTPDLDYLPAFVLDLGRKVDWASEEECFQTLAEVLLITPALIQHLNLQPLLSDSRDSHMHKFWPFHFGRHSNQRCMASIAVQYYVHSIRSPVCRSHGAGRLSETPSLYTARKIQKCCFTAFSQVFCGRRHFDSPSWYSLSVGQPAA